MNKSKKKVRKYIESTRQDVEEKNKEIKQLTGERGD